MVRHQSGVECVLQSRSGVLCIKTWVSGGMAFCDRIVVSAVESHVDRSIGRPSALRPKNGLRQAGWHVVEARSQGIRILLVRSHG